MTDPTFIYNPTTLPLCGDPDRAAGGLVRWQKRADEDDRISDRAAAVIGSPLGHALIECLFGNSPFLGQILLADVGFACELF